MLAKFLISVASKGPKPLPALIFLFSAYFSVPRAVMCCLFNVDCFLPVYISCLCCLSCFYPGIYGFSINFYFSSLPGTVDVLLVYFRAVYFRTASAFAFVCCAGKLTSQSIRKKRTIMTFKVCLLQKSENCFKKPEAHSRSFRYFSLNSGFLIRQHFALYAGSSLIFFQTSFILSLWTFP